MIPVHKWKWMGHAAHFICSRFCRFRMATKVGKYIISTVGEYYRQDDDSKPHPIGAGKDSMFETYVFRAGKVADCGCTIIKNGREIDGERYATAKEAQAGHMKFCRKYAEIQP